MIYENKLEMVGEDRKFGFIKQSNIYQMLLKNTV